MIRYLLIIQTHLRKITSRYRLGIPLPLPLRARCAAPGGARGPGFCYVKNCVSPITKYQKVDILLRSVDFAPSRQH